MIISATAALASRPRPGNLYIDLGVRWALPPWLLKATFVLPLLASAAAARAGASWMTSLTVFNLAVALGSAVWWVSLRRQRRAIDGLSGLAVAAEEAFGHATVHWLVEELPMRATDSNRERWVIRQWESTLVGLSGGSDCTAGHDVGCVHHPVVFRRPPAGPLAALYERLESHRHLPGVWLQ